jgi:hypothetical protein
MYKKIGHNAMTTPQIDLIPYSSICFLEYHDIYSLAYDSLL